MKAETLPTSLSSIATAYNLTSKEFEKQYKDHLSNFKSWDQKEHAEEWMLFPENSGAHLSIDEVALTNGELYTIVTNRAGHGKRGALVGMFQGTDASMIARKINTIEIGLRNQVTEVTLDMSPAMEAIVRGAFPKAKLVTDRFHVQQLISEALQEIRVSFRREVMKEENEAIKKARKEKERYKPKLYHNGDTRKQLLARSRYLLFKPSSKWHDQQKERAAILFLEYPKLKKAYNLSMMFRSCYEQSKAKEEAKKKLGAWYSKIETSGIDEFLVPAETVRVHEDTILNYFINRSTNAAAESFNAKLKNFRSVVRGVTDKKFYLFRVAKLYG
jgi:transposase